MATMRISLFGTLQIQSGVGQVRVDLEPIKAQELLCYLLLHRDRLHRREALAELLWDSKPANQTKKYMRHTLWQLQSGLAALTENAGLLLLESEWIGLNPDIELWLDVAEFERAFARVQDIPGTALDDRQAQMLRDAVQQYQGDLLEGWYHDWCIYERERFHSMYLLMLEKLLSYCTARRKLETGLRYGFEILRHDCARERTHRRLMRLYYLAGSRTGALRQYEQCVHALERELGVPPTESTMALYEQIRSDQLRDRLPATNEDAANADPVDSTSPHTLYQQLKRIQATLAKLQDEVNGHVQSFEKVMNTHH